MNHTGTDRKLLFETMSCSSLCQSPRAAFALGRHSPVPGSVFDASLALGGHGLCRASRLRLAAQPLELRVSARQRRSPGLLSALTRRGLSRSLVSAMAVLLGTKALYRQKCRSSLGAAVDAHEVANAAVTDRLAWWRQRIRLWESTPPWWYEALEVAMALLSFGLFLALLAGIPRGGIRRACVNADMVVDAMFILDYICRFWARRGMRLEWTLRGQPLCDLLATVGAASERVPHAFVCLRGLRLLRLVRRWRIRARRQRNGRASAAVVLATSLFTVQLQLGSTLSVMAALFWQVEGGATGGSPSLASLGDAYFFMLNVFAGEGMPFLPLTVGGKVVAAFGIIVGLCTIPLSLAELISGLGLQSVGGDGNRVTSAVPAPTGVVPPAERAFWARQLNRLDALREAGLLLPREASLVRDLALCRDPRLALLCEAYAEMPLNKAAEGADTGERGLRATAQRRFSQALRVELRSQHQLSTESPGASDV